MMPKIERLDFPKKYKLKSFVLIMMMIAALFGLWLKNNAKERLSRQIIISEVSFSGYGSQYVELSYMVENRSNKEQNLNFLARVWSQDGEELASSLYPQSLAPRSKVLRSKMLDRLSRSLKEGERPYRAEVSLYLK